MRVSVLLKPVSDNKFRATVLTPSELTTEAPTRQEALDQLTAQLQSRVLDGEVVQVDVPLRNEPHPWAALAGSWVNHPDRGDFEANLRDYRRSVDVDPDRP